VSGCSITDHCDGSFDQIAVIRYPEAGHIQHARSLDNLSLISGFWHSPSHLTEPLGKHFVAATKMIDDSGQPAFAAWLAREAATREILEVMSRSRDNEAPVFDAILENASKLCKAPLAYLSMKTEDRTHVISPARRGSFAKFGATLDNLRVPLAESRLAMARAIVECRVFREDDISNHELYRSGDPNRVSMVEDEGARSLLVIPLINRDSGIGSIVLYRREVAPFSDDDVRLVEGFAAQAVIAIENVRQFKALEYLNAELADRVEEQVGEIERMGRLKRFLPAAVADTVVSSGSEAMLKSHRALLGVLFCDIRGFTAFCETAEPEETIEVLQTYHEEMGKLIDVHGAGVDLRMGDGIMVLFNDPLPCEDPAGDAVRLAMAMRERMVELCGRWKRLGHRLGFGVGVSLGYATVGMVGYEGRYDYTASGTSVNLAARLCDLAKDGEILLSPRAHTAVEDDFEATSNGEVSLKGIREPVEVFRLTNVTDESSNGS
jgi:class 3 adenylate cyclase